MSKKYVYGVGLAPLHFHHPFPMTRDSKPVPCRSWHTGLPSRFKIRRLQK